MNSGNTTPITPVDDATDDITDEFVVMFKDLTFQRVKDVNGFLVYAAKIHSLTADGERYVFLIARNEPSLRMKTAKIQHLRWVALQTRTLTNETYKIPLQDLDYRALDSRFGEKIDLNVTNRTDAYTTYSCDKTIRGKMFSVSIRHDPRRKTIYQHPNAINLRHALKTFQCIIRVSD